MTRGTFVYIGGFRLPDKNAAAHRVISVAKILQNLGYSVTFLHKTNNENAEKGCNNFKYVDLVSNNIFDDIRYLYSIDYVKDYVKSNPNIVGIIAYNYPSIALNRLRLFCKKIGILCIADITEWYGIGEKKAFLYQIIKFLDTSFRMMYVHKKLDGCIVISNYLYQYYIHYMPIIKIPPLVDINDKKWDLCVKCTHNGIRLIYAGSPSREKERLDIIVKAVSFFSPESYLSLNIIGITDNEFKEIYNYGTEIPSNINFYGRLNHLETIKQISRCDYSLIIRDINRVTNAGFPTKFVESIACGTKVIANASSDLEHYIQRYQLGILLHDVSVECLIHQLKLLLQGKNKRPLEQKSRLIFDYRNYIESMRDFLNLLIDKKGSNNHVAIQR